MLNTTARDEADYGKNKVPEKINEQEFFIEYIIYQNGLVNN